MVLVSGLQATESTGAFLARGSVISQPWNLIRTKVYAEPIPCMMQEFSDTRQANPGSCNQVVDSGKQSQDNVPREIKITQTEMIHRPTQWKEREQRL